jgi:hypothetical protein
MSSQYPDLGGPGPVRKVIGRPTVEKMFFLTFFSFT